MDQNYIRENSYQVHVPLHSMKFLNTVVLFSSSALPSSIISSICDTLLVVVLRSRIYNGVSAIFKKLQDNIYTKPENYEHFKNSPLIDNEKVNGRDTFVSAERLA